MKKSVWTIRDLLEWTSGHFEEKGIPEARVNVEWLLAHTLSMKRFDLYVNYDRPLNPEELARFRSFVQRRVKREPLQYIIGTAEFMGLSFLVRPGVLIPRPETELLVETVLTACQAQTPSLKILDIGVGSGCILVSIGHYLLKKKTQAQLVGIDISAEAIAVAQENAERIAPEADITLVEGDITLVKSPEKLEGPFDLIISNPPYIPSGEMADLQEEVRSFEPRKALDGGKDGLDYYRHLCRLAGSWLKTSGGTIFLEIGHDQSSAVSSMLEEQQFAVKQIKDYNHVDRVIAGSSHRSI